MNISFSIADLNVNIFSESEFYGDSFEQYHRYVPNGKEKSTINVEVIFTNFNFRFFEYEVFFQGSTYMWLQNKEAASVLFAFGSKYKRVESFEHNDDIWFLACDINFSNAKLYIKPEWRTNECFISEFITRPWIQRLCVERLGLEKYVIMHGGAVLIGGKRILLMGDSGVGKSTLCKLFQEQEYQILADDRVILMINDNTVLVNGTPWNIKNPHFSNNNDGIVNEMYFLKHSDTNSMVSLDEAIAFKKIIKQVYRPISFSENTSIKWLLSISKKLSRNIKSYELNFLPTNEVISILKDKNDENFL